VYRNYEKGGIERKMSNPYFRDVPKYGDLYMEQVIVDYDYPLLSVLRDGSGNRYLSMCFDTRGCQQWLITSIINQNLVELLTNRMALDIPYRNAPSSVIHAVRDYTTKAETFHELAPEDVPDEFLPRKGEYLDAEEGEWRGYVTRLTGK